MRKRHRPDDRLPAARRPAAVSAAPASPPAGAPSQPPIDAPPGADTAWLLVFACWVIASVATLGALFFSEVMQVPPCVLCWYQRIFMFPLVLLLPLALFPFDPRIVRYALPLALAGALVAVFHQLLVAGYIPESIQPCTQGVPCSETHVRWFGFVTIPLLSIVAFAMIGALLIAAHFRTRR